LMIRRISGMDWVSSEIEAGFSCSVICKPGLFFRFGNPQHPFFLDGAAIAAVGCIASF
jgi:hypothetical protein